MLPSESDPQDHCQLPVTQVGRGSRDELDAHQIMSIETQGSRNKLEALQFMPIETLGSRAELDRVVTLVDTSGSGDELEAQVTQVDTPSGFLVPVAPSSSDYPHSVCADKWSFHTIS